LKILIMIRSMIIVCLMAASTMARPADGTTGGCPGGYAEGAEIERGRLIYICQGGQVVPKGCIAEDLSRISVGANFDKTQYRLKCQLQSDGSLSFEPTGCLQNGQEHKVDEIWDNGNNFYTCKVDGAGLRLINQGCVDGGKRVNLNEKIEKEDGLYLCNATVNSGSKLVQAGCVKNGKQYSAGDSFDDGNAWFNCTRTGREKVTAKIAGCIKDGKRLNDGDRYIDAGVFHECIIEDGKASSRASGCAQTDETGTVVERRLGCTWVEGTAPLQYEWECQRDAATGSAKKVQVRCNYKVDGGVYNIGAGCYRTIEKAAYGCSKQGESLKLDSYPDEKAAEGAGLHAC
jgi:hypothetical protein